MELVIEVATNLEEATREKGVLLEKLCKEILEVLQYRVSEEIRVTGMEVDLLAKHKLSGEEILVECKAHKSNLSADVITKLIGNTYTREVSSGWLMTTGGLGKDAKGIEYEWDKKGIEQRRKLQIYTAEKLVDTLTSAKIIVSPIKLKLDNNKKYMNEATLLITKKGYFWAKKSFPDDIGIANHFELYDTNTGEKILKESIYNYILNLDSSFSNLNYNLEHNLLEISGIKKEYDNIIQVSSGDKWADYRPSRPKDFVGREMIIKNEFNFFNDVLTGESKTRLTAIKSPSGWGKSSLLLKIKEKSQNKRNRSKIFVCSVDLRAASSERYAELALITCFNEAIKTNFIKSPKGEIVINSSANPFASEGVKEIFEQLHLNNKLIILYFDQFEEIFSKIQLLNLFHSIREISKAVDSAKENFILGYAWKTDGTIPTEHPAYNMWHSLKDSRFEKNLEVFSKKEITKALTVFSKELGQELNPNVKKYLEDQCQGYPWLLKKLSIHVYETIKNGDTQENVITQGLDIGKLFEQDITNLSSKEFECVKKIANESPADFFKLDQDFGSDTINSLLNKRIVIRKAHKLILYWDIFRDYVMTGILPNIDVTYVPQGNTIGYIELLNILLKKKVTNINEITAQIKLGRKATENLLRDMVVFGNISRKGEEITLLDEDEKEALKKVYDFFSSHIFIKRLKEYSTDNKEIVLSRFQEEFFDLYSDKNIQEKTLKQYYTKLIRWTTSLGMIEFKAGHSYSLILTDKSSDFKNTPKRLIIQNKLFPFFGSAPATRLMELFDEIQFGAQEETYLNTNKLRNAITTALSIGMVYRQDGKIFLNVDLSTIDLEEEIAKRVLQTDTIQLIHNCYQQTNELPSRDWIGKQVNLLLNKNWKKSSERRIGSALLQWYIWSNEQLSLKE